MTIFRSVSPAERQERILWLLDDIRNGVSEPLDQLSPEVAGKIKESLEEDMRALKTAIQNWIEA